MNVGNHFYSCHLYSGIKQSILEKNAILAVNVGKTCPWAHTSIYTRKSILRRDITNVMSVGKPLSKSQHWIHKRIHTGDPMYVLNVSRPLCRRHTWLCIKEFILEKSLMNAVNVEYLFFLSSNFSYISKFTQEINHIYVPSVGRLSLTGQTSVLTRSLTPERSLTYSLNVERPSLIGQISINTRPFILEKTPIFLPIVGGPSFRSHS